MEWPVTTRDPYHTFEGHDIQRLVKNDTRYELFCYGRLTGSHYMMYRLSK